MKCPICGSQMSWCYEESAYIKKYRGKSLGIRSKLKKVFYCPRCEGVKASIT